MALWRSTIVVSAMTMLSRIAGLVRDVIFAQYFGAGKEFDAFAVAFKIPNFFRRLFAEGSFSNAFVPVLSEYKETKTHAEVQLLISKVFGNLLLIMSLLTVVAMIIAPSIIYIYASGFASDSSKFQLTVDLFRLTAPYLLFMSLTAFAASVLNSYGSFLTPAFAPVLLNLLMILAAVFAIQYFDPAIMAIGWAVLIAGFVQFALQIPELWRKKLLAPPSIDFKHEGVRKILTLMLPGLFGVSVTQINLLLNTMWASYMQNGSISWMYAAERMTELPLGLIGVAIGTVILPSLSARSAEKNQENFKAMMDWAIKVIIAFGVPASIALYMLAMPLIQVIFQRGAFTFADTQMTAFALQAMSAGVISFMLIKVLAPGFYAKQDTKTPVKIGLIAVVVNAVLTAGFVGLFKIMGWSASHVALGLAVSGSSLVNAGLLYYYLHQRDIFKLEKHWIKLTIQFTIANVAMIVALILAMSYFYNDYNMTKDMQLFKLILLIVVGLMSYTVALLCTGFTISDLKMKKKGTVKIENLESVQEVTDETTQDNLQTPSTATTKELAEATKVVTEVPNIGLQEHIDVPVTPMLPIFKLEISHFKGTEEVYIYHNQLPCLIGRETQIAEDKIYHHLVVIPSYESGQKTGQIYNTVSREHLVITEFSHQGLMIQSVGKYGTYRKEERLPTRFVLEQNEQIILGKDTFPVTLKWNIDDFCEQ